MRIKADPSSKPWMKTKLFFAIIAILLGAYHFNGDVLPGKDATANVYLSVSLLEQGNLSYEPLEFPFLFQTWRYKGTKIRGRAAQLKPDVTIEGIRIADLVEQGKLVYENPQYCITPSRNKGIYVNTFGIGSGICMLPAATYLKLRSSDWYLDHAALWKAGKMTAAILIAVSAALLFLCCCKFTNIWPAFILALAYGFATCVWSISSQTLWQHGPNAFFLALGTYFLLNTEKKSIWALGCGAAYGYAVLCRPTSAIMVIAVGVYLLLVNRKALLFYVVGGLPFLIGLILYNYHYFGVPFDFGQLQASVLIAEYKTGLPEIWQTPIFIGIAGLLFSPSRGVLIYSPFLVGVFAGFYFIWKEKKWHIFRPLSIGALFIFLVAAKWFDWWGGWCYGYRSVVDLSFFGVLFLVPIMDWLMQKTWRIVGFAVLIAWAVFVQFVGAFAYNLADWNAATAYRLSMPNNEEKVIKAQNIEKAKARGIEIGAIRVERVSLNIDLPRNRSRLWSITDNQIVYYMTNFSGARKRKRALVKSWLKEPEL